MPSAYLLLLSGYITWGMFPLYWSLLSHVPALEVTLHRIVWSVPILTILVWPVVSRRTAFLDAWRDPTMLKTLTFSALLIAANWGIYVWAVAHQRILEASLGYFISPLLQTVAGVLVFRERLNRLQQIATVLALSGVIGFTLQSNTFPFVGLGVAISFAAYTVVRKQVNISSVPGLFVESLLLMPMSLLLLCWRAYTGEMVFLFGPAIDSSLMALGGLVTVAPLALFTAGSRLLPLSTVGILFFITPTLQFLFGTWVFNEPVSSAKLVSFTLIWLGLGFYITALLKASK